MSKLRAGLDRLALFCYHVPMNMKYHIYAEDTHIEVESFIDAQSLLASMLYNFWYDEAALEHTEHMNDRAKAIEQSWFMWTECIRQGGECSERDGHWLQVTVL